MDLSPLTVDQIWSCLRSRWPVCGAPGDRSAGIGSQPAGWGAGSPQGSGDFEGRKALCRPSAQAKECRKLEGTMAADHSYKESLGDPPRSPYSSLAWLLTPFGSRTTRGSVRWKLPQRQLSLQPTMLGGKGGPSPLPAFMTSIRPPLVEVAALGR